jgi:hypothetical protein
MKESLKEHAHDAAEAVEELAADVEEQIDKS